MDQSKIRNFSIIAHIDHGKSTLADRLLEACGAVSEREMESQLLDNMDLERERGITIKARAVTLSYEAQDGETYTLNLIDTPGHVDFNYEVSRSLAACEGAVLVVDASQGIEAQTLANTYLALDNDLEIRPVINKIDLPAADPVRVKHEIEDIIGIPALEAPEISAKAGVNIPSVLEDVVQNIPAPAGDPAAPLRALIFDSYYDAYKGVIVYFRIMDGTLKKGMSIRMMASGAQYQVLECGLLRPLGYESCGQLQAGQVGYLTASIKNVRDTEVGDTITGQENPAAEPLPGYRKAQSMVYCGVYTEDGSKYPDLRDALEKLSAARTAVPLRRECVPSPLPDLDCSETEPRLTVSVVSAAQLAGGLLGFRPARVYLPLELLADMSFLPEPAGEYCAVLPRVWRDRDEELLLRWLDKARKLGVTGLLLGNLGHFPLVRDGGWRLYGDYGLNVFNSRSLAYLREKGLESACLSFELRFSQIRDMRKLLPAEALVYGRLPLMITENCLIQSSAGCRCEKANALHDRTGAAFPLLPAFGHRTEVQNSRPLYLADRPDWRRLGLAYARLRFTTESPEECAQVFRRYQEQAAPAGEFTRGLYQRGVE